MKLWFWDRPETDEERYERLSRMMEEAEEFAARPREEVAGHPHEELWYMHRLSRVAEQGDPAEIRVAAAELLQKAPTLPSARLIVSTVYMHIGDETEAAVQLGIALALDPSFYVAHSRLARILIKRGERQAAQRVLENGWEHHRKHIARKDLEQQRAKWFSLMDAEPTLHSGGDVSPAA